jgi:hypothetical protein
MVTRSKIFFIIYMTVGIASLALLIASRVPVIASCLAKTGEPRYGDLFNMSRISDFKAETGRDTLCMINNAPHQASEAKIICYGDSFSIGFMQALEQKTGIPSNAYLTTQYGTISGCLTSECFAKDGRRQRFFILERAERNLFHYASRKENASLRPKPLLKERLNSIMGAMGSRDSAVEYIITSNALVFGLTEVRNTLRFRLLGDLSARTPLYRRDNGMLFYGEDIKCNNHPLDLHELQEYVVYLKGLQRTLRESFGLTLIVMPVPSKYTVYGFQGQLAGQDKPKMDKYNMLLPELYSRLGKEGIPYVDLYHPFMEETRPLYFISDTHWNKGGMELGAAELSKVIEKLETSNSLPVTQRP